MSIVTLDFVVGVGGEHAHFFCFVRVGSAVNCEDDEMIQKVRVSVPFLKCSVSDGSRSRLFASEISYGGTRVQQHFVVYT